MQGISRELSGSPYLPAGDGKVGRQTLKPLSLLGGFGNGNSTRCADGSDRFRGSRAAEDENSGGDHSCPADALPAMHRDVSSVLQFTRQRRDAGKNVGIGDGNATIANRERYETKAVAFGRRRFILQTEIGRLIGLEQRY